MEWGTRFRRDGQGLSLGREGGHSRRRILHAGDQTGQEIERALLEAVESEPNIRVLEDHLAVDLLVEEDGAGRARCRGALALDHRNGRMVRVHAVATMLATGGCGQVHRHTTNPPIATGDGVAMAKRAGARIANMEFIQFHPTCLFHPHAKSFLISEAVRGEGGLLKLPDGERFMPRHDERAELAPRDVVARAIDFEIKKHGIDCVYLDITHKGAAFIREHFPTIHARCLEFGIDITTEPIPVVPAAHYTCGGLTTDLRGRTQVAGLYALGEAACTGLHGANRLASNSLLECLVFSEAAAADIHALDKTPGPPALPAWDESRVTDADEEVVIAHNWDELRRTMWNYVGIVRTDKRLERARHRIELLQGEIEEFYGRFRVTNDLIELRNLVLTAELIVRCAQARRESRGLHYSRDHPGTQPQARDTVLDPRGGSTPAAKVRAVPG
jgi:L-aspartate oxidase